MLCLRLTRSCTRGPGYSWLPVNNRVDQLKLNHVFKVLHDTGPVYLKEGFVLNSELHNHYTRGSELTFFKPQVSTQGLKTFTFTAILAWNSLPLYIRELDRYSNFKFKVKQWFLQKVKQNEENVFYYY